MPAAIHNANEEVVRDLSVGLPNGACLPGCVCDLFRDALLCSALLSSVPDRLVIAKLISLRFVAAVAAFDFVFVGKKERFGRTAGHR